MSSENREFENILRKKTKLILKSHFPTEQEVLKMDENMEKITKNLEVATIKEVNRIFSTESNNDYGFCPMKMAFLTNFQ